MAARSPGCSTADLRVFDRARHLALTAYSTSSSQGLLSLQDNGVIQAISEAPQRFPMRRWRRHSSSPAPSLKDPDVESLSSFIGVDGTNTTSTAAGS